MRHRKAGKQLGRTRAPRKSLLRNLATDLITRGAITTTEAKGKALRPYVEKLITIAKQKPYNQAKSQLRGKLFGKQAPLAVVRKYKERYKDRSGGYLRLIKAKIRRGDTTRLVRVEWV
ncbi:50S ribosomal protein L17 [Patescibacteria group bacterium]